ncbi:sorbosone dehydrogenase family protein [Alcaligenaceae bacterium C4P045]|nr:sorbosone dehydrogenase family protein [Alcaligenaceae bacterium C4P045]
MNKPLTVIAVAVALVVVAAGGTYWSINRTNAQLDNTASTGPNPTLPEQQQRMLPTVYIAPAQPWTGNATPTGVAGTKVVKFAAELNHPRWLYVLPNGDVLVAETNAPEPVGNESYKGSKVKAFVQDAVMARAGAKEPSANRITLLRDADGDGVAEVKNVFLKDLTSPYGMVLVGNELFVANANGIVKFPYKEGDTSISAPATKVTDLPGGLNHHWTKNVVASKDGTKLYATVGSNSNVGENGIEIEEGRAAIWEIDRATGNKRLFATGLRNPNGMGWEPSTGALWTVVNERDELGGDLVPDYLTSVQNGGFYGWPYSYFGQNVDNRIQPQKPELVAKAIKPDYALGTHVAPLGMTFAEGNTLPQQFANGAFVGLHGSWNRKPRSGYSVIFVPFANGKPSGQPIDVLTDFVNANGDANGRPVGVTIDKKGGLLVADDVGNVVWRVAGTR